MRVLRWLATGVAEREAQAPVPTGAALRVIRGALGGHRPQALVVKAEHVSTLFLLLRVGDAKL